jgi:membrane protein
MVRTLWKNIRIFEHAAKRLLQEKYTDRASALAFTTLLALVPLISVIVSLISIFPIFDRFTNLARNYILTNFIPTSGTTIDYYLQSFTQQASKLPLIGLIFLFITAALLIITVEHTLNEIWQAPKRTNKFAIWLLYWAILIFAPIFIGLSVFLSSYVFSLSWFSNLTKTLHLTIPLLIALPLVINTIIFSLLYIIVPHCKVKWSDGLYGGLVASILFETAKIGFAFYIKQFPSYELIYGALATIPIFLVWIYISWIIILFGAMVTRARYLANKS